MYRKGYYSQLFHTALYNTYNTNPSYFSDKIYKNNTSQGGWGMAKDDTNHVFHIFSITLATASSLQTLFITITTFSLIWQLKATSIVATNGRRKVPFSWYNFEGTYICTYVCKLYVVMNRLT